MRLHSRDIWLPGVFLSRVAAIMMPWDRGEKPPARGLLTPGEGFRGTFLAAAETNSGILPVSSMLGTECQRHVSLSLEGRKDASGRADELQDQVSPPVSSRLTSLLSVKCYWGFLPTGSDVCLMLKPVCEH